MSRVSQDTPVVQAEGLAKVYRAGAVAVHALRDVSVTIRPGDFVAITGASGSGKTTLLNILGCVDLPSSGRYLLDGQDVTRFSDGRLSRIRNEKIGFVFQTFNLLPRVTALENVGLPLIYSRRRVKRNAPHVALERVGLAQRARHRPNQLSGGEQQRVAIARALVVEPALILADEPTGNLDTRTGEEIMAVFQRLNRAGSTIVLVTHEPIIARHAHREVRLRDGRVVYDEENDDIVQAEEILATMPAEETGE